jgi:agmatine deiminase
MPAEWSPHSACLILFPHNPRTFRLEKVQEEILHLAQQIAHQGKEDVYLLCNDSENAEFVQMRVNAMERPNDSIPSIHVHVCPSNDTWARDTGPTFVWQLRPDDASSTSNSQRWMVGLDWDFNAYGGPEEGCYWPCTQDQMIAQSLCQPPLSKTLNIHSCYSIPIILEGGSIHTDGEGTLLTTEECLLHTNRNPHLQKGEIEQVLKRSLGVQRVLWLPTGVDADDDTNGHVDNFCCFAEPGHVLLAWTDDDRQDVENYIRCRQAESYLKHTTDAQGRILRITKLYLPSPPLYYTEEEAMSLAYTIDDGKKKGPETDSDKDTSETVVMIRQPNEKMAASYINFYIANGAVLVPQFGNGAEETDSKALATLQEVFGDCRTIVGIPSREILLGGGNIHCQTQQVPLAKF